MSTRFIVLPLAVVVAFVAPQGPATDLAGELNSKTCEGSPAGATLQVCFARVLKVATVGLVTDPGVDPNVTVTPGATLGKAGIVRFVVQDDFLEIPAVSFDPDDLCAPFGLVPFPCEVVLEVPVQLVSANADPEVDPVIVPLADAYVGTLTVKHNGAPVLVVPGLVDLLCPSASPSFLLDTDCDGFSNVAELQAGPPSNPFYKYSTPGSAGVGFPLDWDADSWTNTEEVNPPAGRQRSNPLQRCSTPKDPNGWSVGNPTHSCET